MVVPVHAGPIRVGAYLRKSRVTMKDRRTRERALERGISTALASLEIQREDIIAECARMRDGRERIVVVFETDVLSGAREDRTGRENIYALAERGEIDEVWVWAFDRWSREDEADAMATISELRRLGRQSPRQRPLVVLSVTEPYIDPYDPLDEDNSRYNADVFAAFQRGRFERKRLIERSQRGTKRARSEGVYLGGIPFGFRPIDGQRANGVEVDPDKIDVLREAFERRREGLSLKAVQAATGLSESTLHFILHGRTVQTRPMTEEHAARLRDAVGSELYDAVQRMRRGRGFDKTPRHAWLLRGLIRCPTPECGRTMLGHASTHRRGDGTDGKTLYYYVCNDRRVVHGRRSVHEAWVVAATRYDLARFALDPARRKRALALARSPERRRRVVDYSQRMTSLEDERRLAERILRSKRRSFEWWEAEDARLEREIAELTSLQALSVAERSVGTCVDELESMGEILKTLDRSDVREVNLANDVLRRMIERVTVDDDGDTTIVWRPVFAGLINAARPTLRLLPTPAPAPHVSAKRVAEELGMTRRALRAMLLAGEIPGAFQERVGLSTFWRIPRSWLRDELGGRSGTETA